MTPVIIIDADPIVYAAGFAAQSTTYEYILQGKSGPEQHAFEDGNIARQFLRDGEYEILDKTAHVEAKDPSFARQCAKTQIESILKTCRRYLDAEDASVEMYLSGPDNFRYKIATIAPYKGDRPPPPIHYQTVRDYLTQRWNAVVISGIEADDRVSIRIRELIADGTPCVLATIDKDLDQVPGLHYDYKHHTFYTVTDDDAEWMFFRQCLSGDSTDNIPGCYRVGDIKALKLLEIAMSGLEFKDNEDRRAYLWGMIVAQFAGNMAQYKDRFPDGMTPEAAALETARLVFMQHYEGQLWNPPSIPHGDLKEIK